MLSKGILSILQFLKFFFSPSNFLLSLFIATVPIASVVFSGPAYLNYSSQLDLLDNTDLTRLGKVNGDNFFLGDDIPNIYKMYNPITTNFRKELIPEQSQSAQYLPRSMWLEEIEEADYTSISFINDANIREGNFKSLNENQIAISSIYASNHDLKVTDELLYYPSLDSLPIIYSIQFIFEDFLFSLEDYYQGTLPYQGIFLFAPNDAPIIQMNSVDYLYFGVIQDNFASNTKLITKSDLMNQAVEGQRNISFIWLLLLSFVVLIAFTINLKTYDALDSLRFLKRIQSPLLQKYIIFEALSIGLLTIIVSTLVYIIFGNPLILNSLMFGFIFVTFYYIGINLLLKNEFKIIRSIL